MNQSGRNGLYTSGVPAGVYHLPHPRLGLPVVLVIRKVILRAFEVLAESGVPLAAAPEDSITAALRNVIENRLRQSGEVPGFSRRFFESVIRHAQTENFDASKLGKAPDLCFRLRNDEDEPRPVLSTHEALFVECKPIDRTHAAGSCYCDQGLCRFVDGDYAWAMEEALMLGYVRDGRTIEKNLIPAMQEERRRDRLKTVELPRVVPSPSPAPASTTPEINPAAWIDGFDFTLAPELTARAEPLRVSRHRRGFFWPDGKGLATEISVYHSWHRCA